MAVKLSVIIPVYCVEATLERCLQSVVGQTFRDIEVILVDDGSPDGCPQLCDEWAARDSRISVIHQRNRGLSAARNAGLDAAQGEWVTFADSDDFLDTDTYALLMAQADDCDLLEYPFYWHYGSAEQQLRQTTAEAYDDAADYWLRGHAYEHTYAWNKLYRRTLFSEVRFPEGKVFDDAWVLPRLLSKVRRIRSAAKGCYYYCQNPQGITARADGRELAMLLEAHRLTLSRWCDDRYYMHVLNIQLDVSRLTGAPPTLPRRHISVFGPALTARQRLKALLLNLIGIDRLCNIYLLRH